ncbi:CHAT domain-containing protein [Okeanomitos corallinicola TIOX110]|uniref:CHAT domain-containing protein n=1 Tax=Okeanomitos corallinicola TIOX110 TaxID=3133117 RepID=A0ABZ2UQZ5_9CYAN
MKFKQFISIFLSVVLTLFLWESVQAQTGNQSDITNIDTQEFINPDTNTTIENRTIVNEPEFNNTFLDTTPEEGIEQFEELQAVEYSQYLGTPLFGEISSHEEIGDQLNKLAKLTGRNAAILYVTSLEDKLSLILVPPKPAEKDLLNENKNLKTKPQLFAQNNQYKVGEVVREIVVEANSSEIEKNAKEFRSQVTNSRSNTYFNSANKLYNWIIKPIEPALELNKIHTIVFCLDSGLRTLPVAALYDGEKFLIEKYSVGLIPSFSLTDTRYVPIVKSDILALGISQSTEGQEPLPSVPLEIQTVSKEIWPNRGQTLLNQESTLENLESLSRQKHFGILHLATHGDFKPGSINNSYIQLWNQKLRVDQIKNISRELGWQKDPKVEMLVLSACRTAVGSNEAELGFSGLSVQAGVKSVLGSLWYVSDQGSLALMTKFYEQLNINGLRSESLRQAQLAMLTQKVRITDKELYLSTEKAIPLPPELNNLGTINLSHPYYWSAFTMVGNWN